MNAKAKIRLDSIERAHRTLDALPEHHPEELTKTQAIQKLIIPIRATQSKGYSLAAIGKVLSECGIPITTGALRAYVSEANAGAGGKRKTKAKRTVSARKETQSVALKSGQIVNGLLLRQDGTVLVLADSAGKEVRVPAGDVEERAVSALSPMPANFAEQIPEEDFYHLLAYLLAQRVKQ